MRGLTLVELLVALVVCGMAIAGIYRLFYVQSKVYVIQDQVVEIQQDIRTAMEMMVRDIRLTGFDYDNSTSLVNIKNYTTIPYVVTNDSITVWFELYRQGPALVSEIHAVTYSLNGTNLERQLTINGVQQSREVLLENVRSFQLVCGRDGRIGAEETQDGVVNDWVDCGTVDNNRDKIIAVRVTLTRGPEQANPEDDRFREITPRTLTSTVTMRNLSLRKL